MPVNRNLWKQPISIKYMPEWHCPTCSGGYLRLKTDSLHSLETKASLQAHDNVNWDPDWIEYRFSALLKCNNEMCQEVVSAVGRGRIEMVQTGNYDIEHIESYYPDYISPSPPIIAIPKGCPDESMKELRKAFDASWGDYPSAANHIRTSVERLLDHLKEPKTKLNKKGDRARLSLHDRIINIALRDKQLSDSLLAVKWLGNVGSHSDDISQDDIYDAFDIVELVLDDLFTRNRDRVNKLVSTINKKKGSMKK